MGKTRKVQGLAGKSSTMRSFKDPSLSNAVFFLDLLNGVRPGTVDYSLMNKGADDEEKRMNGELAVETVAERKRNWRYL